MNSSENLSKAPFALGDQWWVLDRALSLQRELGEKKGREVLILRELRTWDRDFPRGSVFAWEIPDFLVKTPRKTTIGLEITECLRRLEGTGQGKGSLWRARFEAEEKVKRLAEDLYYGRLDGGPEGKTREVVPVRVILHWKPAVGKPERMPRSIKEMAETIVWLVRRAEPGWRDGCLLEIGSEQLGDTPLGEALTKITVRREPYHDPSGREHHWLRSGGHLSRSAGVEDITSAIASKESAHASYLKACDEAWLVITLIGGPDSFGDFDKEILHRSYRSSFTRLLLLCTEGGPLMQRVFELTGAPE